MEQKKGGADKEKSIGTTESQLQHTGCTYQVCSRPGLGNDTSLPACEEYVEDNPRLQVGYTVAQMFETGSFLWLFSFESSQAVVSLMSGGGVGVGDRLDTLDTDLVKII